MHILNSNQSFYKEVANACDLCLKPWRHSVIDDSPESTLLIDKRNIDVTLRVECRCKDGKRFPENDLEIEIFKSGEDLSITLSWLFFPERAILWHGTHSVWMNSETGKRSPSPEGGSSLEALARRLKSCLVFEE